MEINFLTLGSDCSPAAALRDLNLRKFALPFDWVVSNINILETCLNDKFSHFHKQLHYNSNKTRMIDYYGFQFPHDYPLNDMVGIEDEKIGEGIIEETPGKTITDNWHSYHETVLNKYERRIERFNTILYDSLPIIVLCRYTTSDALKLQKILLQYHNIDNIYIVNSSIEMFASDKIKNIHTEKNGIWNDSTIWKKQIDEFVSKIAKKSM